MMAVITQNIGADKPEVASQTKQIALIINAIVGLLIALALDECCRAIFLFYMWLSKRWQKINIIHHDENKLETVSD